MSDIFISYNNEDRLRAQMFAKALEGRGWSIFWDRAIPTGKTWPETIGRELEEARCVVVLWSETAIKSPWVRDEADDAKSRGVLFPVRIDKIQPPIGFRGLQTVDLVNWKSSAPSEEFDRLVADIAALIKPPIKEPRSQASAKDSALPPLAPELPPNSRPDLPLSSSPILTPIGRLRGREGTSPTGRVYLLGAAASLAPTWGWFTFFSSINSGGSSSPDPSTLILLAVYMFISAIFGMISAMVWLKSHAISTVIVVWLGFFATSCIILYFAFVLSPGGNNVSLIPLIAAITTVVPCIFSILTFLAYDYVSKRLKMRVS
jgi:TIR domain